MKKTTLTLLLAICAPGVFAASSTDLNVNGTITPKACDIGLAEDGVVDYGKLTIKDLQPSSPTSLPRAEIQVEVNCEGETFFTLSTVDNRAGTSAINPAHHGLGTTNDDEKLGSAAFALFQAVADGAAVNVITSLNGGANWSLSPYLGHQALTSFAAVGGPNTPIAIQELIAQLRVYSIIAPADGLTVREEVGIDGEVSLQLTYL